jgi:SAM-dependent methyltransferase
MSGGRSIVASDVSPKMLAIAQRRLAAHKERVKLEQLDAEAMPSVADGSVDAYSISLCLKICNRGRVLDEAFRILRPGGRLIILEASNIPWKPLHWAYLSYMSICMPALGWLATGGDSSAYTYLLRGIREFPTAEALAVEIREHGFDDVAFERQSLGIVAIHTARKPGVLTGKRRLSMPFMLTPHQPPANPPNTACRTSWRSQRSEPFRTRRNTVSWPAHSATCPSHEAVAQPLAILFVWSAIRKFSLV